jgi:hypothetical protein
MSEALNQAREKLDAVMKEGSGGYESFRRLSEAKSEWDRQMYLNHECYGEPFACISCGCSKDGPCVSHEGNRRHMAELKQREVTALEAIARQGANVA